MDKREISLRPTNADDQKYACEIHHRAYRDVVERQFGSWDEALQDSFFEKAWSQNPHQFIMIDEVCCGYISVQKTEDSLRLLEIVIEPDFQGQKIGRELITNLQEEAKTLGLPMSLQVLKQSRARKLYEALGFEVVGETETHFEMRTNKTPVS